ncbi:metallophosphoesterase [Anaerosalibacter bizertensis]|uniref:Metallophosphoesterase n=1 Tax=Anaerosalibacter bizertensis TaxID=932217 RepID=A0A844FG51_9FIRM|nr:metallophosphoesterase [Anaerosalibacter bizertensis]MBV1818836.1 metallophosphoesterase family protein [Bacteroidales bacterium MSK.15.36]HHV27294.1 metallophosphoesterase [Tissierellia bacterium]MBU5293236.1 metallophosphoesterase family protein [Anaerosalibacter bizertensis]MCB5558761.1 metallophosphoesterase [Anaerosalibacter bizertensis]MCG4564593.1 metallophosphoesterase [Anaerosalibacter bizertensis]
MKILFFTDTHIRGTTPKNRKDNLVETLEKKFYEILSISKKYNVDYILHGGDLFDRPDVSVSIVSKFASILNKFEVPIYMICGNHDIYGHNPHTINRTMLGLFNSIEIINLIDENEVVFLEKDNIIVQLTGQPYTYNIDDKNSLCKYIVKDVDPKADYSIHMVHGMLLNKPFIKGIPYTLIDDIKSTKADITLSGHYHSGFGIIKSENKYFINPGSLIRITNSLREIERTPEVVLIEIDNNIDIKLIPLETALPGEEILDREKIETFIFKNEKLVQFKQSIDSTTNFEKLDINEVLLEVSTAEGVSENIKEEALKRIASSQMKNLGDD